MSNRPETGQFEGAHPRTGALRSAEDLQIYETRKLFGSASEIGISHAGSLYKLKITRQGKLILNK